MAYRIGRESGVAAVELALVLPVLISLLTVPIFLGIYFWHYSVVNKAAASSASYISRISKTEMKSPTLQAAANKQANAIAAEMLAGLMSDDVMIDVDCDNDPCGSSAALPSQIKVTVTVRVQDVFFGLFVSDYGWPITGQSVRKFGGN